MNDDTLREKLSNLMADLMVDVSLKKLSKFDGGPVEKGRQYLEAHNGRLTLAIELVHQYAQAYAESIIGPDIEPTMNGKKIPRGQTVTIDMENNTAESCKFIEANGKYLIQQDQRTLNNEKKGKL